MFTTTRIFATSALVASLPTMALSQVPESKLTVAVPENSRYTIEAVPGHEGTVDANGIFHARVIVTLVCLTPPKFYKGTLSEDEDSQIPYQGILGKNLNGISQEWDESESGDLDKLTGKIKAEKNRTSITKKPSNQKCLEIFDKICELTNDSNIKDAKNEYWFLKFKNDAIPNVDEIDFDKSFGFRDWIYNRRIACELAWHGKHIIDLHDVQAALAQSKDKLKLLSNPDTETDAVTPAFAPNLSAKSFQDYGQWYFETYDVNNEKFIPGIQHLIGVKVKWVLEVSLDASKSVTFPIVGKPSLESHSANSSANNTSSQTDTDKNGDGAIPQNVTTDLVAKFTALTGFPIVNDLPGIDPVVGAVVTNNGPAGFAGINARINPPKKGLGNFQPKDRFGAIVGFTDGTGGQRSTILSGSYYLNENALLFGGISLAGGAFRSANNSTRQSPAIGLAFRFGVRGVTADQPNTKNTGQPAPPKSGPLPLSILGGSSYLDESAKERSGGIWFINSTAIQAKAKADEAKAKADNATTPEEKTTAQKALDDANKTNTDAQKTLDDANKTSTDAQKVFEDLNRSVYLDIMLTPEDTNEINVKGISTTGAKINARFDKYLVNLPSCTIRNEFKDKSGKNKYTVNKIQIINEDGTFADGPKMKNNKYSIKKGHLYRIVLEKI